MFSRRISGWRVIKHSKQTELGGIKFKNYGSSAENYPNLPYFTTAAAIGMEKKEIDIYAKRLDEALEKIHKTKDIPPQIDTVSSIDIKPSIINSEESLINEKQNEETKEE